MATYNPLLGYQERARKRVGEIANPITGITQIGSPEPSAEEAPAVQTAGAPSGPQPTNAPGQDYMSFLQSNTRQDPFVQSAREQTDASKAVSEYLARQTGAQTSQEAGFAPGTLQYQRVQDREMAGANAANLERERDLGALTRQRGLDEERYTDDLIQSLSNNPVAQNYIRRVQAAGGDVRGAYEAMFSGSTGAEGGQSLGPGEINQDFRPMTDAEADVQSRTEAIIAANPEMSRAAATQMAREQYSESLRAQQVGETEGLSEADRSRIIDRVSREGYEALTPEEQDQFLKSLPRRDLSSLPTSSAAQEVAGTPEAFIELNGTPYEITGDHKQVRWSRPGALSDRHREWTVVTNLATGETEYISSKGDIIDYEPPDARGDSKIRYRDGAFVNENGQTFDPEERTWR